MVFRLRIRTVGIKEEKARLMAIAERLSSGSDKTLTKSLEVGKAYATSIAPIDTGAMVRAIHFRTKGQTRARTGYLMADQPNHPRTGTAIPYHIIMHMNPNLKRWRGDPQFMFTTKDWLETYFPAQMRKMVSVSIRGTGMVKTVI